MHTFMDDDAGYLGWISEHPEGYVLNLERSFNPTDLMLHRAECRTIRGIPAHGEHWTLRSNQGLLHGADGAYALG